jgi:DNA-binding NarL/FixJ family response regulator
VVRLPRDFNVLNSRDATHSGSRGRLVRRPCCASPAVPYTYGSTPRFFLVVRLFCSARKITSTMDAPPVQYVRTSDGYNIAYGAAGTGTAVVYLPILFQHFSLLWSTVGRASFSAVAERFKVYVYDGRGQGSSTRGLNESLTLDDLERDLDAVVSRVDESKFVLYGPAVFGLVALRYAARRPERVMALVLWNYVDSPLASYARSYRELAAADWDSYIQNQARSSWHEYDASLMMRILPETMTQSDHVILAGTLRSGSAEGVCERVTAPTLVLATRPGARFGQNEESGRRLAAMIPASQLRLLDSNGLNPEEGRPPSAVLAIEEFLRGLPGAPIAPSANLGLSEREVQVLRLIATGRSNQQIADVLVISPSTVLHHVTNILTKTGCSNRTEAAAYAHRHSLT